MPNSEIPGGLTIRQAADWAAQRPEQAPFPPRKRTLRVAWHKMWHLMSDGSPVTAEAMSAHIWDPWDLIRPSTAKTLLNRAVRLGLIEHRTGWAHHPTLYWRKVA